MFDPEKLIPCVKKQPCIWDTNHEDYHNREAKDSAWEKICLEIIPDYDTIPDKINKCIELKKKWTNIRDYYRKEVQKSGSAAKKVKRYVYGNLLEFLKPHFGIRNETDESQCGVLEFNTQSENEEQHSDPEDIVIVNEEPDISSNSVLQYTQNATSSIDVEDDTNFLLSLRGYIKNMNLAQKINFKLSVMELVKKISMADTKEQEMTKYLRGGRKRKQGDNRLKMEPGKSNIGCYISVDQEELDAFGKYISLELKKLQFAQQAIAQKLTSEVIYYAKMGKLIPGSNLKIDQHKDPLSQFRSTSPEYVEHEDEEKYNP